MTNSRKEVKGEASPIIYADWVNGLWRMIFWNLTAKLWANLDNPIKRFFKGFINVVYVALSDGTLLISVMSQHYNCLMELYTIFFYKILLFKKMYLPSFVILRCMLGLR